MIYPMFMIILLLMPWSIGQMENQINGNETEELEAEVGVEEELGAEEEMAAEEAEPIQTQEEYEPYKPIEQMIKIGITAFSLLLLGLSISAYRKTRLKAIVYAAIAFGLFAAQIFFDYLEDSVEGFETPFNDVIMLGITLAILVLFFMAIVRKR